LLYRASQNAFSALKFHLACDNIRNTLTITKSKEGKTWAGFTPLPWESTPEGYRKDTSGKSFILQLDKMVRFSLKRFDSAIYCFNKSGPSFGGGQDLHLGDGIYDPVYPTSAHIPLSY
jgi:hypothetical protein